MKRKIGLLIVMAGLYLAPSKVARAFDPLCNVDNDCDLQAVSYCGDPDLVVESCCCGRSSKDMGNACIYSCWGDTNGLCDSCAPPWMN